MSPIAHPIADVFLLGCIAASSLVATVIFLRYWRDGRDPLFLAFAAFFAIQGIGAGAVLLLDHPNEGNVWAFVMRLLSVLGILGAIAWKNSSNRG